MNVLKSLTQFNKDKDVEKISIEFKELLLDPALNSILMRIGGRDYFVKVIDIIKFEKDFNELSDDDINEHLEKMASWQFTVISAKSELEYELKLKKLDFNIWKAKLIRGFEKNDFEKKIAAGKYERLLIEQQGDKYEEQLRNVYHLETLNNRLSHIFEILSQRNETLRSILKRRDFKKGRGSDSAT